MMPTPGQQLLKRTRAGLSVIAITLAATGAFAGDGLYMGTLAGTRRGAFEINDQGEVVGRASASGVSQCGTWHVVFVLDPIGFIRQISLTDPLPGSGPVCFYRVSASWRARVSPSARDSSPPAKVTSQHVSFCGICRMEQLAARPTNSL